MIRNNILETVGGTPVVRIRHLTPEGINLYAKLEAPNPTGSVKDRMAVAVITDAERRGVLKPGQTVIEATSGNTGIALAMVCAVRGYPLVVVMADSASRERQRIIRYFGAELVLTPSAAGAAHMVEVADDLACRNGWFCPRQFDNPANPRCHRETTAREILDDFADRPLDAFVCGYGTGGTFTGIAEALRAARPDIRLVLAEPDRAALLSGGDWQPHSIYGWSGDFVPGVLDDSLAAEVLRVTDGEALGGARDLARREGIFCGISSGAALAAALRTAQDMPPGSHVLTLFPDTAERYLSTELFEHLDATDEQPAETPRRLSA